jgi:hypothetical protein
VEDTDAVRATNARLSGEGLATATEDEVTCCYAVQDKVWVDDPDGAPWEIYTVLGDSDAPNGDLRTVDVCGAGPCATQEVAADQPGETVDACC